LLSFNNNSKTGAAFKMAPNALVNDGLTDVIILHDISRRELLAGFLKIFNGEHIYCRGCEYFQTDYAKVETSPNMALMPDGELFGSSPFELEVISGELEIAVQLAT
jgi:diacylglycerol kinase (ATP)